MSGQIFSSETIDIDPSEKVSGAQNCYQGSRSAAVLWTLMCLGAPFSTGLRTTLGILGLLVMGLPGTLSALAGNGRKLFNPLFRPWTFPVLSLLISALHAPSTQVAALRKSLPRLLVPVTFFHLLPRGANPLVIIVPLILATALGAAGMSRNFENHNLIAGLTLIWGLPLLHMAFFSGSEKKPLEMPLSRRVIYASLALAGAALIFQFRCLGALIGLGGALFCLLMMRRPLAGLLVILILAGSLALPQSKAGFNMILHKKTSLFRLLAWQHAMDKVWKAPLLGYGPGSCKSCMADLKWPKWAVLSEIPEHPHSLGLLILLETGFLGAAAFSAALAGLFIGLSERGRFLLCGVLIHNSVTSLFIDSGYTLALFMTLSLFWLPASEAASPPGKE